MWSLRWKLVGALLLVAVISVGVMAFLVNRNTQTQFELYVQGGNTMYVQRTVTQLGRYYSLNHSWTGVESILEAALRTDSDRLVLANTSGRIVADTAHQLTGQSAGIFRSAGLPIETNGTVVGTLYPIVSSRGAGAGRGMENASLAGSSSASAANSEEDFLGQANRYLWIAGSIAIVIALVTGFLITRQITRPVKALTRGAHEISEGNLGHRVEVHSHDEIGELAESFNNMAGKLENSERSRRQLVSDVAHELRTPLTIIQGTVEGIEDGVFPADKEHLGSIKEQTVLLNHLVNDLRDLSLAESGQLKLEKTSADIGEMVKRKLEQFAGSAGRKGVRLNLEIADGLPEIKVDLRRMEQVIGNLLSNAIRHTPQGGQVTVSVKTAESNPGIQKMVLISVADTGEGIPPEHLPHIFERFYRVESSRSRSEGGVGLGLAIVKQMVQAHGGRVQAASEPGRGSTFTVEIPAD